MDNWNASCHGYQWQGSIKKHPDTQGHIVMSVTAPFPSFDLVSAVRMRAHREAIKKTKINSHHMTSRPALSPISGENPSHVSKSNFGASKTFCRWVEATQTHGIDDESFSNHFPPKWTGEVKHSQKILLMVKEGGKKLRAGRLFRGINTFSISRQRRRRKHHYRAVQFSSKQPDSDLRHHSLLW